MMAPRMLSQEDNEFKVSFDCILKPKSHSKGGDGLVGKEYPNHKGPGNPCAKLGVCL